MSEVFSQTSEVFSRTSEVFSRTNEVLSRTSKVLSRTNSNVQSIINFLEELRYWSIYQKFVSKKAGGAMIGTNYVCGWCVQWHHYTQVRKTLSKNIVRPIKIKLVELTGHVNHFKSSTPSTTHRTFSSAWAIATIKTLMTNLCTHPKCSQSSQSVTESSNT